MALNDNIYPVLEIGNSGAKIRYAGDPSKPMFDILSAAKIIIEKVNGKILVSTDVRDRSGQLIARMRRNEWVVAPPPKTWDRNYNSDTIEVVDNYGDVVLQVKALEDRIQLQGLWWSSKPGYGFGLVEGRPPVKGGLMEIIVPGYDLSKLTKINEVFLYPSSSHLGKLAN